MEEVEQAFAALERIVVRGQEQGELKPDLDPRFAALIVYGALEEILTGWVFGRLPAEPDDVARAEQTVARSCRTASPWIDSSISSID